MTPRGELWRDFRSKLQGHRLEVLGLVRGMSEEAAEEQPNDEWSVKQQIAHMCETEEGWLERALAALQGRTRGRAGPPGDGQAFARDVEAANAQPLWFWVTRLKAGRAETIRRLAEATLTDEALEGRDSNPSSPDMTAIQMLRALYRHDRMHLEQIQGKPSTFALGARPSGNVGG